MVAGCRLIQSIAQIWHPGHLQLPNWAVASRAASLAQRCRVECATSLAFLLYILIFISAIASSPLAASACLPRRAASCPLLSPWQPIELFESGSQSLALRSASTPRLPSSTSFRFICHPVDFAGSFSGYTSTSLPN